MRETIGPKIAPEFSKKQSVNVQPATEKVGKRLPKNNALKADVAVVGGGASGLMSALWASLNSHVGAVALCEGQTCGSKILLSGGGRCNLTHRDLDVSLYAGSSIHSIRKVFAHFSVEKTLSFFRSLGVVLKCDEFGKYFPASDCSETVRNALVRTVQKNGAIVLRPFRVDRIEKIATGFHLSGPSGSIESRRVILATGGMSYPRTGSDGTGFRLARDLSIPITPRLFPALVPLFLPSGHFLCGLSGISCRAVVSVVSHTGRLIRSVFGDVLLTHTGLSGPAVLDISRYYLESKQNDVRTTLVIQWLPDMTQEALEKELVALGPRTVQSCLRRFLPLRLVQALCRYSQVDSSLPGHSMTREQRRTLVRTLIGFTAPIFGSPGFEKAEATAGGIPLSALDPNTLESRDCPGVHAVGELCDVDGPEGGYNLQWAWSSGYTAGVAVHGSRRSEPK